MSYTDGIGWSQTVTDYHGRISDGIRQALKDQAPGVAPYVTRVSDQRATPDREDNRADWRNPKSNARQGV